MQNWKRGWPFFSLLPQPPFLPVCLDHGVSPVLRQALTWATWVNCNVSQWVGVGLVCCVPPPLPKGTSEFPCLTFLSCKGGESPHLGSHMSPGHSIGSVSAGFHYCGTGRCREGRMHLTQIEHLLCARAHVKYYHSAIIYCHLLCAGHCDNSYSFIQSVFTQH